MATTAEKDKTTMQVEIDGKRTDPMTIDEFGHRVGEMLDRRQLSFDVGDADGKEAPDFASLKISGSLPLAGDLKRRTSLRVQIVSQEGEILADRLGVVTSIQFKDETKDGVTTTERIHTVKVP